MGSPVNFSDGLIGSQVTWQNTDCRRALAGDVVQAAGIVLRAGQLQLLALQTLDPLRSGAPDDGAQAARDELVQSVMSALEGTSLVVECTTCLDADRVLAAAIGCSSGSIATTAGGITCMTFSKQDGSLREVSCLNHCGHL